MSTIVISFICLGLISTVLRIPSIVMIYIRSIKKLNKRKKKSKHTTVYVAKFSILVLFHVLIIIIIIIIIIKFFWAFSYTQLDIKYFNLFLFQIFFFKF